MINEIQKWKRKTWWASHRNSLIVPIRYGDIRSLSINYSLMWESHGSPGRSRPTLTNVIRLSKDIKQITKQKTISTKLIIRAKWTTELMYDML